MKIILNLPKSKLKANSVSLSEEQIITIVEKHAKDTKKHFSEFDGGWKLNKSPVESDILYEIFGFHISELVNQSLFNLDLQIEYNEKGAFVRTEEEYCPIYMNSKTGKIHLVENSDNKSYIEKFSESKGFVEIGRL